MKQFNINPRTSAPTSGPTPSKAGVGWKNTLKIVAGRLTFANLPALHKLTGRPLETAAQGTPAVLKDTIRTQTPKPAATPVNSRTVVVNQDDDEKELNGAGVEAAARGRERDRVSAILASEGAARNPVLALSLALNTGLTRKQAIAMLNDMPAQGAPAPAATRNAQHASGGNAYVPSAAAQAIADSWAHALTQATRR